MQNHSYEKIAEIIHQAESIAIGGHISPDGDAVSACLSLCMCVHKLGKKPYAILEGIPKKYDFIKGSHFLTTNHMKDLKPDLFIAVDCGDIDRLGEAAEVFKNAKTTIVIDHHVSNPYFGEYNRVEANSSSTSEMIFKLADVLGTMDRDIAEAIYAGIIFDTGGLRFSSTSTETFNIIGKLIQYKFDFTDIFTKIMYLHTFSEAKIFSKAISNMKMNENIVFTSISLKEMEEASATPEDLDGIVEYMLNTNDAEVALFVYEKTLGNYKVSLRSKGFDVSKIAMHFNGGGHVMAAGYNAKPTESDVLVENYNYLLGEYNKWRLMA